MFGVLPAYGFFIRHVNGITLEDIDLHFLKDDFRPPFVLNEVNGAEFHHARAQTTPGTAVFDLKQVRDFSALQCPGLNDVRLDRVDRAKLNRN